MLIVIVALLVVLLTDQRTRPMVLFFGILPVVSVVYVGGFVLAGLLARTRLEKIEVFFGTKLAVVHIKGVQLSLGWIPTGGSVAFPDLEGSQGKSDQGVGLSLAWRIMIIASGPIAVFLVACCCIGSEEAARSLFLGFPQILEGAFAPLSKGEALVGQAIDLFQREGFVITFGVMATKITASNLLPVPPANGGQLLMEVFGERFQKSNVHLLITLVGIFCLTGIIISWCIAICGFVLDGFQGA